MVFVGSVGSGLSAGHAQGTVLCAGCTGAQGQLWALRSFESQVPLRSSGQLCTFGQMNPTQHVCLLCRPWDPTEDSPFWFIFLHFVVEEGKTDAVMPLVSHFMQRGYRAGPRAQLTERDQAGTCPQRCPSCTGLSFHTAEGRVWVQKEFSSRWFQNEGVPTQKRELFSGW